MKAKYFIFVFIMLLCSSINYASNNQKKSGEWAAMLLGYTHMTEFAKGGVSIDAVGFQPYYNLGAFVSVDFFWTKTTTARVYDIGLAYRILDSTIKIIPYLSVAWAYQYDKIKDDYTGETHNELSHKKLSGGAGLIGVVVFGKMSIAAIVCYSGPVDSGIFKIGLGIPMD